MTAGGASTWPATLTVERRADAAPARGGEPLRSGLPLPRGALRDPGSLALYDTAEHRCAVQTRVLNRWPDGSVRWVLLDWRATPAGDTYRLHADAVPADAVPDEACRPDDRFQAHAGEVELEAGGARLRFAPGEDGVLCEISAATQAPGTARRATLSGERADGERLHARIDSSTVVENGPLRVGLRLDGTLAATGGGRPDLDLRVRVSVHLGSGLMEWEIELTNPRAAGHPGGQWPLGADGAVFVRRLDLELGGGAAGAPVAIQAQAGDPWQSGNRVLLHQESSGGELWDSPVHLNREGRVPLAFRGYRLEVDGAVAQGLRASPVAGLADPALALHMAPRRFWQTFPGTLGGADGTLRFGLLPGEHGDLHEIQGGERTTAGVWVLAGDDPVDAGSPLAWTREPSLVRADPEWVAASGALYCLSPRASDPHTAYHALVDLALDPAHGFEAKRERIDEYGWRHFGDLYADHEAVFHTEERPFVSHYNNQYDAVAGFAVQFLRGGDARWFDLHDALARHVTDVDLYHTVEDKWAYNHGLFWHTTHHVEAGTSSHRTFPAVPGGDGGGPSSEHLYSYGLLLHHFLTGSQASRDAVIEMGRYIIDADDGSRTVFKWLAGGPTGHVSQSAPGYHGPGRGPGNALEALLNAHVVTGDAIYIDKAHELVRRCVHPGDDLDGLGLVENPEERWFYMIMLRSLCRYLEYLAELGETGADYAYAREVMLHYVRWAAARERPILSRPDLLEFANETWPAQDLRKSEVFDFAARLVDADERARFIERAGFFFEHSLAALAGFESRTLTRPLVLLCTLGYKRAWYVRNGHPPLPEPSVQAPAFGRPAVFVPQKQRAIARLRRLVAGGAAGVLGLAAWLALAG